MSEFNALRWGVSGRDGAMYCCSSEPSSRPLFNVLPKSIISHG